MPETKSLNSLRLKIDKIDLEILSLINQRAQVAREVGVLKGTAPKFRPEREAELLQNLQKCNDGPVMSDGVRSIFVEIISACRALEEPPIVSCLGPAGTFSEQAVLKNFGKSCKIDLTGTIDEVFKKVESRNTKYGVVPIENSSEGAVARTLDLLVSTNLKICGEILLPIHHNLLTRSEDLKSVDKIYSHAQSFGQCQRWLIRNMPNAEQITVSSNAEGARLVASGPENIAAIAAIQAAERYKVPVRCRGVEDEAENITRFVILGMESIGPATTNKTSIIMSTPSRPGALFELLEPLSMNQVNMIRLESRPSKNAIWDYIFFVDILGHQQDPNIMSSLEEIRDKAAFLKILGSYPTVI